MNEKIRILGLDVSKASVTACLLSEVPDDLKAYHRTHKLPIFKANVENINDLLNLEFDAVALEPTGIHYAKIWVHWLEQAGKPIRWVGHREVRHYREAHRLPNKSDNADAIAIAAYALENWHKPKAFVEGKGEDLRYLYLQLQSLIGLRGPALQRLRLQLAHECPELAERVIIRAWRQETPGMIQAIAGEKVSIKWQKEIERSIGIGLTPLQPRVSPANQLNR
ncbi:MAG: IS110 family transposase [Leptolyngbyaceae cyanobacterium CSU_1_4]|nr:IS110 family transposase [Leptolyngbyaceae cyanobacterium CSU_1_4]